MGSARGAARGAARRTARGVVLEAAVSSSVRFSAVSLPSLRLSLLGLRLVRPARCRLPLRFGLSQRSLVASRSAALGLRVWAVAGAGWLVPPPFPGTASALLCSRSLFLY